MSVFTLLGMKERILCVRVCVCVRVRACVRECVLIPHASVGLIVCLLSERLNSKHIISDYFIIRTANCAFLHVVNDTPRNVFFSTGQNHFETM